MADDSTPDLNRRGFLKTTGAVGTAAAFAGVSQATPGRSPGPKEDEIIVGVSKTADSPSAEIADVVPGKAEVVHENKELSYVAVKFPSSAAEQAKENFVAAVTKKDRVKYAEQNATHQALLTPDDPEFGNQYAPQMVNAPAAWDTQLGSESVTIAVVDQGIKYDHEDLSAQFGTDKGQDFVDSDGDPYPDVLADEYHGTHVGGIAAATTNNGTGVSGISNCRLISGRALSESGSGSTSDIADAIQWAADQGATAVNLSLGGGGYTSTMKNAVSYAVNNGCLPIAANGNDGTSSVSYPAAYSECVAVSALDPDETLASYSNYGSATDLAAPGSDVLSTWTTSDKYKKISGTSMATPVVSGVAGLAASQYSVTVSELRNHLKATAVDIGLSSDRQGAGRVDAANAVTTEPGSGDGGGGGGGGGGGSTTSSVTDSLSDYADSDCWSYGFSYSDPSQVVVELDGPSYSDFDLYASTGTTTCPTTSSYDYRSWSTDSQESITIDNPDDSTDLQILVDSYDGSGDYTLTITEYE
jgi:serine protease